MKPKLGLKLYLIPGLFFFFNEIDFDFEPDLTPPPSQFLLLLLLRVRTQGVVGWKHDLAAGRGREVGCSGRIKATGREQAPTVGGGLCFSGRGRVTPGPSSLTTTEALIATDPFPFPTTEAFRHHLRSTAFARRPALHDDDDDLNPFPFPTTEAFRHHLRSTAFARRPALHDDDDLNPHCVRRKHVSPQRTDLTRVVEELVFNSLDAGATKYYFHPHDMMHMYVKCSLCVFMLNRGEALSSISDVSLLQVVTVGIRQQMVKKNCTTKSALISTVTKAHGMPNGYCKVIKCSKCLYLGIDDDRQDVGTTVDFKSGFSVKFELQFVYFGLLRKSLRSLTYGIRYGVLPMEFATESYLWTNSYGNRYGVLPMEFATEYIGNGIKNPVLQVVGARLLPFTPIPVRSESRSEALKLLLAVLTTRTPVPAYANTLLEL
ncbi:hypothetical protein LXL04_016067 [Taraxacum kok-saghyz]